MGLISNIHATIKTKTRAEWKQTFWESLTQIRIWIQEHGEMAALIGFAFGFIFLLQFKLFIVLFVIIFLLAYAWYMLAPIEHPPKQIEDLNQTSDKI